MKEEMVKEIKNSIIPEFLYHYTSIGALALILESRKIRFRRLSLMNDPLEGISEDFQFSPELVYCSSWTANELDNIPLWKLYTDLKGVRLKLPSFMFKSDNKKHKRTLRSENLNYLKLLEPIYIKAVNKGIKEDIIVDKIFGPNSIIYVNHSNKVETKGCVLNLFGALKGEDVDFESDFIDFGPVGMYKHRHWEFEQEWRFRITCDILFPGKKIKASEKYKEMKFIPDYIDMELKDNIFDSLEILLAPLTNRSDELMVKALCEKYLPDIEVKISKSEIRIRE